MKAQRKLISFIGLGSGNIATALYGYLRVHPEVSIPAEETNFFSDINIYAKGIDWYEKHFSIGQNNQKCGELADNYLFSTPAIALISRTYPSAKLFAVIENPLLAVRVAYVEARRVGKIQNDITLPYFLKQYPEVLTKYCFGQKLTQYFSYYSHNDLLVLTASEVGEDPLKATAKLYEHLELDTKFIPLSLLHLVPEDEDEPKKRPGIIKRSIKFPFKMLKKFYKFLIRKFKIPKVLPDSILVEAKSIVLTPELEAYLKDYYLQDVTVLSRLLHRNFDVEWGLRELKVE